MLSDAPTDYKLSACPPGCIGKVRGCAACRACRTARLTLAAQLRVHASGRVTMAVGNVVYDVSRGTDCSFLQEVRRAHCTQRNAWLTCRGVQVTSVTTQDHNYCSLGHVANRFVVIPDVDTLLPSLEQL